MISRRSFFGGLAATLVAPAFVRRALTYCGVELQFTGGFPGPADPDIALLKRRMDDCYAVLNRQMAEELYGDSSRVLVERNGAWHYISTRESLLEQSDRHVRRAQHWREQGKPDYAMGSLMKAARAEDRARSL